MSDNPALPEHHFKYLDLVAVTFTVVLLLSNIASSAKLIDWGFRIGQTEMIFDAGTLFFPFAYIFGDVLTEVYGYKNARRVIWMGFGALIFGFLMFLLIRLLPGEALWAAEGGQAAFERALGGFSSGGIVLASILGYLTGSFSNAIVLAVMKHLTRGRWLWTRTISSTIIGEFLDTLVFVLLASWTAVFPWELFWSLTLTNYLFKVTIEAVFTPLTYLVTSLLKKAEKGDGCSDRSELNPRAF